MVTTFPTTNTIAVCIAYCASLGHPVAGLQAGDQCYCSDEVAATGGLVADDSMCNVNPCTGDPSKMCGGPWRMASFVTGQPFVDPQNIYGTTVCP